jgi:hypothetical protein
MTTMADEADRANDTAQQLLDLQLTQRRRALAPIGLCHFCAEPVNGEAQFCDIHCRDDWQREENLRVAGHGQRIP